jgi:HEAT repeat protein
LARIVREDQVGAVRAAAVSALSDLGTPPAFLSVLEAATRDRYRGVRLAAAMALLKAKGADNPLVVQTLVAYIADPNPIPDRIVVFQGIMQGGHDRLQQETVKAIANLLPNCDPGVLADLILCLEVAGKQAAPAVPALEKLANQSDDPDVRGRASIAVADLLEFHDLSEVNDIDLNIFSGGAMIGMAPSAGEVTGNADVPPYSPRVVKLLKRVIGDDAIGRDWRAGAILRLSLANAPDLADAARVLIRQLGSENPTIRVNALSLLGQVVAQSPVKLSELDGSK